MALVAVIRSSAAATMMELEIDLKKASDALKSWDTTSICLSAGCDLFMRYVTRTKALEAEDFDAARAHLILRGDKFGEISWKARRTIAMLGQDFIFDGSVILVHGFSQVVLEVLKMAASNKKLFQVLCTDRTGLRFSQELAALGVPVKLLIDSTVAYTMDEVDMVIVGADGVVESGGIINMVGTYQIALVAHSMNKPVYVAAESTSLHGYTHWIKRTRFLHFVQLILGSQSRLVSRLKHLQRTTHRRSISPFFSLICCERRAYSALPITNQNQGLFCKIRTK